MLSAILAQVIHPVDRNILVIYPSTLYESIDAGINAIAAAFCEQYPSGLLFSDDTTLNADSAFQPLRSTYAYLGMTTSAILLDVRSGFPLDYFLSIAATIRRGGLLVLLMEEPLLNHESQRFHQEAIETPFFHDFLYRQLEKFSYIWRAGVLTPPAYIQSEEDYSVQDRGFDQRGNTDEKDDISLPIALLPAINKLTVEQQRIADAFLKEDRGVFTLFSARGTGKSWLASHLIGLDVARYILTAPNQNATNQYQSISGLQFRAPDALFLTIPEGEVVAKTLIIEEAAKMPLSHLERLCSRFEKVLMISSVENYEGTGQGLREKIHDLVSIKEGFQLLKLQRFTATDPLKKLGDALMFEQDTPLLINQEQALETGGIHYQYYDDRNIELLRADIGLLTALYHLLNATHYQTNIQDIRRLMDAPQQVFVLAYKNERLVGAIWGIEEGGLSLELTEAVFKGLRRPKGNLVAQMLTAQSYFPEAMREYSVRVSRISVVEKYRRLGIGRAMIEFLEKRVLNQTSSLKFISVSFGLTVPLLAFWESLGYQLAHLGFHLDKTTGLYSAVVLKGEAPWIGEAVRKFKADAYLNIQYKNYKADIFTILAGKAERDYFDQRDICVINAFRDFKRGKHTVENALLRENNLKSESLLSTC